MTDDDNLFDDLEAIEEAHAKYAPYYARLESLLRRHAHPKVELCDADDPEESIEEDPLAYMYGEVERSRDRVRRRVLTATRAEFVALVITDIVASGYLDEVAAENAELREQIARYVDEAQSQDLDQPT